LSKGLGAPVGSLLIGTEAFIAKARRLRKVMGGGMRQAGYIAAAGIYALDNHIARLKEDHIKAKIIAETLRKKSFVTDIRPVMTNIVIFDVATPYTGERFIQTLGQHGIYASQFAPQTIRMVTHLDISDAMIEKVIQVINSL
jgi:threonine aldolase